MYYKTSCLPSRGRGGGGSVLLSLQLSSQTLEMTQVQVEQAGGVFAPQCMVLN